MGSKKNAIAIAWVLMCMVFSCVQQRRRSFVPNAQGGGGGQTTIASGQTVQVTRRDPPQTSQTQSGTTPSAGGMQELHGALTQVGASLIGQVIRNPTFQEGVIAYYLPGVAGKCYTVSAIASDPNHDINLFVIDQVGNTVGYDVKPNNHPWVSFCASTTGNYLARLQSGVVTAYEYAVYEMNHMADLNVYFGDTPQEEPWVALDSNAQAELAALDRELQMKSFQREGVPQGKPVQAEVPLELSLNLHEGKCYALGGIGVGGIQGTKVILSDGQGRIVAEESSIQARVSLEYCPRAADAFQLAVKSTRGSGVLFPVAYQKTMGPTDQTQSGTNAVAQTTPSEAVINTNAPVSMQENLRLYQSEVEARGYQSEGSPQTATVGIHESHEFNFTLEGEKCYAVLGVGGKDVHNLDLVFLNPSGQEVDREMEIGNAGMVRVCPRTAGAYKVRLLLKSGSGQVAVNLFRWPRSIRGPFGLSGLMYLRLAEMTVLWQHEFFNPDIGFTPTKQRIRQVGRTVRHRLRLDAGRCYAVVAVGGEGIRDLQLSLKVGDASKDDEAEVGATSTVRYCVSAGEATRSAELSVASKDGVGEYFIQLFIQDQQQ